MDDYAVIFVESVESLRVFINDFFHRQEAWQVGSPIIVKVHIFDYMLHYFNLLPNSMAVSIDSRICNHTFKVSKARTLIGVKLRDSLCTAFRTLPWVKRKINTELERVKYDMEEEVHQNDKVCTIWFSMAGCV